MQCELDEYTFENFHQKHGKLKPWFWELFNGMYQKEINGNFNKLHDTVEWSFWSLTVKRPWMTYFHKRVKTSQTRQSEMADLARRATRWVGTFPYILTPIPNLYDHSFPIYGQITFLTFRRPTTLTFDLKFWKYLSVTVYPYVICMPSFIMIGWEMAEILHFEILRKHGQTNKHTNKHTHTHTNKQTHKHTHKQTWALQYLALPLWGAR